MAGDLLIAHLEDLWQLHFRNWDGEKANAYNVNPEFIANLAGPDPSHELDKVASERCATGS